MKVRVSLDTGSNLLGEQLSTVYECNQCRTLNRYDDALCLGCELKRQIDHLLDAHQHTVNGLHKIITVAEIQDRTIGTLLASVAALTVQVGRLVAGDAGD